MSQCQQDHTNTNTNANTNANTPNVGSANRPPPPPHLAMTWPENPHAGPSGRGWDIPPQFPTLGHTATTHRTTYPQHPTLQMIYGGYSPPPMQHRAWGLGWAPPTNQPMASYSTPTPQEAMEVDDSHTQPETTAPMANSPQWQKWKKDKGKKCATPQELREHDDEERRERREGATLEDDDNMTDSVQFTVMTLLRRINELNDEMEEWASNIKERNNELEAKAKCLRSKRPASQEGRHEQDTHPPPRRYEQEERTGQSWGVDSIMDIIPLCHVLFYSTRDKSNGGDSLESRVTDTQQSGVIDKIADKLLCPNAYGVMPMVIDEMAAAGEQVPGPIKPPQMKRKDPALLDYIKPVLEDDKKDPDSPPMSPNLDGLSERQQAQERQRYDVKKQKFDDKKKKRDLKEKAILGHIPDALGIVEQRSNRAFAGRTAEEASCIELRSSQPYQPRSALYNIAPRGYPMNPLQVDILANTINDPQYDQDVHFEAYELLSIFRTMAGWIFPEHRDRSMCHVLTHPCFEGGIPPLDTSYNPGLPQIERPQTSFSRRASSSTTGRVGLLMPPPEHQLMVDLYCQYIAHHSHPGSSNPFIGIAINWAFQVCRCSVFRYCKEVKAWNTAHPKAPFVPQWEPDFI
ncbi:hypothetical protein BDQ17DRAFT_1339063, partial [Cyathus striatus]